MRAPIVFALGLGLGVCAACGFKPNGHGDGDIDASGNAIDAADDDATNNGIDAADLDAADLDAPIDGRVDASTDAAVDARPPCPGTYTTSNGGSYRYVATSVNVGAAENNCAADLAGRTHLATFETSAQQDPVLHDLAPDTALVWVGARCSEQVDCAMKINWHWIISNLAIANGLWNSGEPNNGGTERAAYAFFTNPPGGGGSNVWLLNNVAITESHTYLCECEP